MKLFTVRDAEIIISKIMKLFGNESICRKIVKLLIVIYYSRSWLVKHSKGMRVLLVRWWNLLL